MTWPVRWDGPQFKTGKTTKQERHEKRATRTAAEQKEMRAVRTRDKRCRVPLCGCKRFRFQTETSHQHHRGMGGDPSGEKTRTDTMVLVCIVRHRRHRVSIDKGTLRWRALTDKGADGPIAWDVRASLVQEEVPLTDRWIEIAVETAIHQYAPFTPIQERILKLLGAMTL